MMPPSFDLFGLYEQYMSHMFLQYSSGAFETTSIDGKPLLTPFQFLSLANHQERTSPKSLEAKNPKKNISDKPKIIENHILELPTKNKENENKNDLEEVTEVITKKIKQDPSPIPKQKGANEKSVICISPQKTAPQEMQIEAEAVDGKNILQEKHIVNKKQRKLNKVVKVVSSKQGDLVFGVKRQAEKAETDEVLTREEILKEDPLLLVYYYEKHLLFDNTSDFDPANLIKI